MPGCRPPHGTSRFKFPKNKKKQELWLNSLKIDNTNEIGDSRVHALHFAQSDFQPNLNTTFSKLPKISPARKFFLSSAFLYFYYGFFVVVVFDDIMCICPPP